MAVRVTPLLKAGHTEAQTAVKLFRDKWRRQVAPYLDPEVGVLTADAAYATPNLRREVRELGYVENIHRVSHADRPTSVANAEKHDRKVFQIQGYPKWRANGHREIYCVCGGSKLARRVARDRHGRAVIRTEGSCRNCGSITITAGKWRSTQNPNRYSRVLPGQEDEADLLFGNPFTFNDPLSLKNGSARFGHNEDFRGQLVTRFGLLKGKSWRRRREQAELDFLTPSPACTPWRWSSAGERRARSRRSPPSAALPHVQAHQPAVPHRSSPPRPSPS